MAGSINMTLLKTDLLTQLVIPPGNSRSVCLTSGLVCVISVSSLRLLRRMFTTSKMILGSATSKMESSTVILYLIY